ncbi:hypothetical protein, partial [Pseudomonas sp. WS 5078]|uniref:hypothetical protein n=1 Tax=Pseudomonas sp. WS 5078 TaxID=2717480 RepID=UPI001CA4397E
EFYSVTRCCQHLISCFDDLKLTLSKSFNSLNLKEFSVSTAPELGRIIGKQNAPSSTIFKFIQISM